MKISRLILSAAAICGLAGTANATRNPTPPPSGIVVHLFGPQSIMSNIAPDLPGETNKPTSQGSGGTASGQNSGQNSGQVANSGPGAAGPADSDAPTMHDILHQMFVVGDPNHPTQPSPGRGSERPPASD